MVCEAEETCLPEGKDARDAKQKAEAVSILLDLAMFSIIRYGNGILGS